MSILYNYGDDGKLIPKDPFYQTGGAGSNALALSGRPLSMSPAYDKSGNMIGYKNNSGVSTRFINSIPSNLFSGGGSGGGSSDEPYWYTPEQQEIFGLMKNFATTGSYGDLFTAGEQYGGDLGNYELSENEQLARQRLNEMMQDGLPQGMQMAQDELESLFSGSYDPYNETGVYSGFKAGVERESQEAADALNRRNAITGDLYATEGVRQQGLLAERTQQTLANKLAELYETYSGQRLQGIGMAGNLGIAEENINMGRLGMADQFGQTDRGLLDLKARREYDEWTRSRSEYGDTLQIARDLLDQRVGGGIPAGTQVSGNATGDFNSSASSGIAQPDWNNRRSIQEYNEKVNERDSIARGYQSRLNNAFLSLGIAPQHFPFKASAFPGDLFSKDSGAFRAWAKNKIAPIAQSRIRGLMQRKASYKNQPAPGAQGLMKYMNLENQYKNWTSGF